MRCAISHDGTAIRIKGHKVDDVEIQRIYDSACIGEKKESDELAIRLIPIANKVANKYWKCDRSQSFEDVAAIAYASIPRLISAFDPSKSRIFDYAFWYLSGVLRQELIYRKRLKRTTLRRLEPDDGFDPLSDLCDRSETAFDVAVRNESYRIAMDAIRKATKDDSEGFQYIVRHFGLDGMPSEDCRTIANRHGKTKSGVSFRVRKILNEVRKELAVA